MSYSVICSAKPCTIQKDLAGQQTVLLTTTNSFIFIPAILQLHIKSVSCHYDMMLLSRYGVVLQFGDGAEH
jgi:hypothetical protein